MSLLRIAAASLALLSGVCAQRTWIVDNDNRKGTDFREIQPAVNAAKDGDTILVRRSQNLLHFYQAATISKGLRIVGVGVPAILDTVYSFSFKVVGLPSGKDVTLKGFIVWDELVFRNSAGAIIVEDVTPRPFRWSQRLGLVTVQGCSSFAMTGCVGFYVRCSASVVSFAASSLEGKDAWADKYRKKRLSTPGLWASRSEITLTGNQINGGDWWPSSVPPIPASAAIVLESGSILLAGDSRATVRPGRGGGSAIRTTGGTIVLDPNVRLLPLNHAKAITGPAKVIEHRVPALTGLGVAPGQSVMLELFWQAGEAAVLFGGNPTAPLLVSPFGDLWVDPRSLVIFGASVLDKTEHWRVPVHVPNRLPLGVPFAFQTLNTRGSEVFLSTPSLVVLH